MVALGALDALAPAGLTVGQNFSVIGFDDVAGASSSYTLPPLTTVAVYPKELGRRSAAALVRGDFAFATGSVVHVDGGLSVQKL